MSSMDKPGRSSSFGGQCHNPECGKNRVKTTRMANGDIKVQCLACGGTARFRLVTSGPEGCKGRLTPVEEGE